MPNLASSSAKEVAYSLDLVSGKLLWGDTLYSVYGYQTSEPANTIEWWTNHVHPSDAMILNQALETVELNKANEWSVAYRFRKADAGYVLVRDHATITRDADGTATHINGTIAPM